MSHASEDDSRSIGSKGWGFKLGTDVEFENSNADEDEGKSKKRRRVRASGKKVSFQEILHMADEIKPSMVRSSEVTECRACKEGYFVKQGSRFVDAMAQLIKVFAPHMSISSLIDNIYQLGETERLALLESGEEDIPHWSKEEIEYHLWTCMANFELYCIRETQDMKAILSVIKNNLVLQDDEGNIDVADYKNFQIMFGLQNQIKSLSNIIPEKSTSFNPKLSVHSSIRKRNE